MRYWLYPPVQNHTTKTIVPATQHHQSRLSCLAKRYGFTPVIVAKGRRRRCTSVLDLSAGSHDPRSIFLEPADKAIVVAFRSHTLRPLENGLDALHATSPALTRSAQHRCLQRHRIARQQDI